MVSIWLSLGRLSAGKKSASCFTFSLRYCKDIVNLLFWVLWTYMAYAHPKWYCQLVENFHVYLHVKNQVHPYASLELLQRCANFLLWVLWTRLLTHTQNDSINLLKTSMFMPKINSSFTSFLKYYILKNPAIWLGDSILAHNSRTWILPDMRLVVKYQ